MMQLPIRSLGFVAAFQLAAIAWGQEPSTLSPDETQIRRAVVAFVDQYNKHQSEAVAALFAPSARMTFADGTEVNGREAIQKSFADTFKARPQTTVSVVVDSIRFLTPDVAVEE